MADDTKQRAFDAFVSSTLPDIPPAKRALAQARADLLKTVLFAPAKPSAPGERGAPRKLLLIEVAGYGSFTVEGYDAAAYLLNLTKNSFNVAFAKAHGVLQKRRPDPNGGYVQVVVRRADTALECDAAKNVLLGHKTPKLAVVSTPASGPKENPLKRLRLGEETSPEELENEKARAISEARRQARAAAKLA